MLNENLDVFVGGEFSVLALVNGVPTYGIFDDYYDRGFDIGSDSLSSDSKKYCFKIQTRQAIGLNHGDPVETSDNNELFEIVGIQKCPPDGKLTDLILKRL